MALINTDWTKELNQVKTAAGEIVDNKLSPMIQSAIKDAGHELTAVVSEAGEQVQNNIKILSEEIHNQRRLTKDDIVTLIDYASEKIGKTIDDRVSQVKIEASSLLAEKISQLKIELEDAAIRSRKTLYTNLALSIGAAVAMAIIGLVYRKISIGQLDVFALFRVVLLSAATGTGIFSALKMLGQWQALNKVKKNAATIAINYLGIVRPNGALGLFFISVVLVILWLAVDVYTK